MKAKMASAACSDKRAHLAHCLKEAVPKGAKLALCFDPEGDLEGLASIVDDAGRAWQILTYQEDDLAFRLKVRELEAAEWDAESPVLLRVAMPELVPLGHRIDLSFLGDVLAWVEGQPIDLRTDAVVTFHTEPVVWPETLQVHAPRIGRDLKGFVEGYWRMRGAIGKDRPLGRHHIATALLLARYPDLNYRDLELTHPYPEEVVARLLALSAEHQLNADDEGLLWEVLQVTGNLSDDDSVRSWMHFPTGEAVPLLILSDFLESQGVQNVALSLSGLGLFSQPVNDLLPRLAEVRNHLKEIPGHWQRVLQRFDQECDPVRVEQAIGLLKVLMPPDRWITLVGNGTPRMVALALVLGYLDDQLAGCEVPKLKAPEPIPAWAEARLGGWEVPHHDAAVEARAATLIRMMVRIADLQTRLAAPLPEANDIGTLAEVFTDTGEARLELLLALARKDADVIDNETRLARLQTFFDNLHRSLLQRLQAFDLLAGSLIRANVGRYLNHTDSTIHFLGPLASRARQARKRLFVWLFDGMRYDTWTEIVKPVLTQNFAVEEEKRLLAPLPSYTQLARKSLFAGGYPDTGWKGFGGRFSGQEQVLAARNFGMTSDREAEQEIVFVDHADTDQGREKLRRLKPRQFNCLVFNISDENLHFERGDLREINDKIRQKVERDILPEMKRLVGSDDLVVVASDHGFVELNEQQGISIKEDEGETRVFYRYLNDLDHPEGISVPYSGRKEVGRVTVLVGRSWFSRDKGRYTRYAHGGLSLPELVVPGIVLHKLEAPEDIRIEISAPERLKAEEDEEILVPVTVKNAGTGRVTIRITIERALGRPVDLARGAVRQFSESLRAELGQKFITVSVEARAPSGRFAVVKGGSRQIPVSVKERAGKVEFSKALDVFGDLE